MNKIKDILSESLSENFSVSELRARRDEIHDLLDEIIDNSVFVDQQVTKASAFFLRDNYPDLYARVFDSHSARECLLSTSEKDIKMQCDKCPLNQITITSPEGTRVLIDNDAHQLRQVLQDGKYNLLTRALQYCKEC